MPPSYVPPISTFYAPLPVQIMKKTSPLEVFGENLVKDIAGGNEGEPAGKQAPKPAVPKSQEGPGPKPETEQSIGNLSTHDGNGEDSQKSHHSPSERPVEERSVKPKSPSKSASSPSSSLLEYRNKLQKSIDEYEDNVNEKRRVLS